DGDERADLLAGEVFDLDAGGHDSVDHAIERLDDSRRRHGCGGSVASARSGHANQCLLPLEEAVKESGEMVKAWLTRGPVSSASGRGWLDRCRGLARLRRGWVYVRARAGCGPLRVVPG